MLYGFRGFGGAGRPGGWIIATEVEVEFGPHEVYLPGISGWGWRIERMPALPMGRPVRVRPDWVCEVLSPSTAGRDLGPKQRAYHAAGVGHFWVVDPEHHTVSIYRWHESGYLLIAAAGAGDTIRAEPFAAVELDIADLFGLWKDSGQR